MCVCVCARKARVKAAGRAREMYGCTQHAVQHARDRGGVECRQDPLHTRGPAKSDRTRMRASLPLAAHPTCHVNGHGLAVLPPTVSPCPAADSTGCSGISDAEDARRRPVHNITASVGDPIPQPPNHIADTCHRNARWHALLARNKAGFTAACATAATHQQQQRRAAAAAHPTASNQPPNRK